MADVQTTKSPSLLDNIGGWVSGIGNIFDAGLSIYSGASGRLAALDHINNEVSTTPKVVTLAPGTTAKTALPSWVIPAAIAAGALVLILVLRKRG